MNKFKLTTTRIHFEVELKDKYVFINGDSGRGKSLFISEIAGVIKSETNGKIESTLTYHLIDKENDLRFIPNIIKEDGPAIFISDEYLAHKLIKAVKGLHAYCIVVTRKTYKDINFSYRCLYKMVRCEEGVSYIKPSFNIQYININVVDLIITEDEKAGHEFLKEIFKNTNIKVIPAGGKNKLYKCIKQINDYYNVLVLCDAGGIGTEIKDINREIERRKKLGIKITLVLPECFEHTLLCSEFIGKDDDIFKYFKPEYDNTEAFCENWIYELTKGTSLEYNHNNQNLSDCWVKDCTLCNSKCNISIEGNKIHSVLANGPCSGLEKFIT